MNEKPTNALIIQCIGTQYSPTCFGTLKCHHQGVKDDPAEIGAQCLYIVTGGVKRRLLQYTAPILLCFPRHWAPISAGSCLTV
jgi:hypothetical protein